MLNFIVNPRSRSGRNVKAIQQIEKILNEKGVEYKIHKTEHAKHATQLAKEIYATQKEGDAIVIIGGDGSLNEAVQELPLEEKPVIGYIPTGSGMDFAHGHDIPLNTLDALEKIINSEGTVEIDIGKAVYDGQERYFTVSAGIGYDAGVCYDLDHSKYKNFFNKIHAGKLGYFVTGFADFLKHPIAKAEVCYENYMPTGYKKKVSEPSADRVSKTNNSLHFISAHITPYEGGGYPFAPSAKCDDGLLSVCDCNVKGRAKFFTGFIICKPVKGYHLAKEGNEEINCTKVSIKTDTPLAVHTDGEVPEKKVTEVSFEIVPKALRLII